MSHPPIIAAVEDLEVLEFLKRILESDGFLLEECREESHLLPILQRSDRAFLFLGHPGVIRTFRLAERVRLIAPNTLLTLITKESSETTAVAALRAGFDNYIRYPSEKQEVIKYLRRTFGNGNAHTKEASSDTSFRRLIGNSPFAHQLREELRRASASDCNVLITGETGTGKELVAELIHENSSRRGNPLECINCAALPDTLFEAELFGHERGAFTGAISAYEGRLSLADHGTIFFDEIGDMSQLGQAKMLRLLEGKPFHRLGGRKLIAPNVRFISATNCDLESMITEGRFRNDLFYRINVRRIQLTPLRTRMEDIPLLLKEIVGTLNKRYSRHVPNVPQNVTQLFFMYDWPGNIRELLNVMEATFANLVSDEISLMVLPLTFRQKVTTVTPSGSEQERLLEALRSTDWNLSKAAKRLSLSRMTVYRRMAKFQISRHVTFTEEGRTFLGVRQCAK